MHTPLASFTIFAADYDCNAYGSGNYNNSTCTTADPVGAPNTGVMETLQNPYMIAGILLIVVAAVLAVRLFRAKK